ncbi:MAG: TIGR04086 family membrane protein [Lachnospiraceae bacterium]
MQTGIDGKIDGKKIAIFTGGCLLIAYLVTGLLLLLLAFLAYKANLSEQGTRIGILIIYVLSSFVAGFITGKKSRKRKFLFGAMMGICYFVVLLLLSLGIHDKVAPGAFAKWSAGLLCMGGGMLGGMLS